MLDGRRDLTHGRERDLNGLAKQTCTWLKAEMKKATLKPSVTQGGRKMYDGSFQSVLELET